MTRSVYLDPYDQLLAVIVWQAIQDFGPQRHVAFARRFRDRRSIDEQVEWFTRHKRALKLIDIPIHEQKNG